jgi:hypothetical protein
MCFYGLCAYAQEHDAQEQEEGIDVFLSENMLKSINLNVVFNNSIDYTAGKLLLLSSSNQFYALGINGVFPVLEKTKNKIDAFSIATTDSILLIVSNKTLYHTDSEGKMVKITDLPTAKMGIASSEDDIYLFEQTEIKNKKEYSLFSLSRELVLTKLISVETPVNSVYFYPTISPIVFFTSRNTIYYLVEEGDSVKSKDKYAEIFTLSGNNNKIISLAGDIENQALYFSTSDTVYRIKDNQLDYICVEFGGILRYDGEGLLIFNPKESLIVRLRNNLLYPQEIKKSKIPAIDPENYLSDEQLKELSLSDIRQLVLQNRIGEAVVGYSYLLAKDPINTSLLAEYAYILALNGAYDCALMNLDRVRILSPQSTEGRFYTALVFSLMGYDDIQADFIKNIPEKKTPQWISYDDHLKLAETRSQTPQLIWNDTIATVFRRANRLAADGLYLQSIALYEEIIKADSMEFLPHVGYSIVLEKVGLYRKALQELETGIALMPDSLSEIKAVFEKRKPELSDKINGQKKLKNKILKLNNDFNPKTMLYMGGMATESSGSFYSRFGLFLNSTFNGAVDFGLSGGEEFFSVNIGISAYKRFFGLLMWGEGINLQTGNSTVFSLKSSIGLSFINRKSNSSWDIFFDYYLPLKRDTKGMFGFSVGKSIYFGKREEKRK